MSERMWRKENHLTLFMGMQASTATLENSVEDPQDFKIELPYNPAIASLGICPRYRCSEQKWHMHPNVNSSNVHNSQTVEGAKISFN